jgi:hypothetical protein
MAATKQQVQAAGKEIGKLIVLVLDGTPNKDQIVQFATEGFVAVQALAAIGIPKANIPAIASNLLEGVLEEVNADILILPTV